MLDGNSLPRFSVPLLLRPLVRRLFGVQNDMTSFLVDNAISPIATKDLDERTTSEVPRKFHAYARTSSFTKCKRMVVGSLSS